MIAVVRSARAPLQDKKWLQDAMTAFTIDEGKRMKELLEVLRRPEGSSGDVGGAGGAGGDSVGVASEDVVAAKETAFDELMILIETIDNSRGEGCACVRVMQCLAVRSEGC